MQSLLSADLSRIVVLGTGGTIAGAADSPLDNLGYVAGRLGVETLAAAVAALVATPLETEQVAQVDSKDMDVDVWRLLVRRIEHHLARAQVSAIVVTHGSDTLEETAYLLQRVLAPRKPVVLTAAMRPSTSLQADGPQNLLDALVVAQTVDASGVVVVLAGTVHGGLAVRKVHTHRLNAFGSGEAGALGQVDAGRMRRFREWPRCAPLGSKLLETSPWPRVEIVTSHACASGAVVDALVLHGVDGIVAAGTGNGSLHHRLEAALLRAQSAGVVVWRSSRVAQGGVLQAPRDVLPHSAHLTAVQARIELTLHLLQERARGSGERGVAAPT